MEIWHLLTEQFGKDITETHRESREGTLIPNVTSTEEGEKLLMSFTGRTWWGGCGGNKVGTVRRGGTGACGKGCEGWQPLEAFAGDFVGNRATRWTTATPVTFIFQKKKLAFVSGVTKVSFLHLIFMQTQICFWTEMLGFRILFKFEHFLSFSSPLGEKCL